MTKKGPKVLGANLSILQMRGSRDIMVVRLEKNGRYTEAEVPEWVVRSPQQLTTVVAYLNARLWRLNNDQYDA